MGERNFPEKYLIFFKLHKFLFLIKCLDPLITKILYKNVSRIFNIHSFNKEFNKHLTNPKKSEFRFSSS